MREERERLERLLENERAERLQERLEEAQQVAAQPWWRRWFGG
jgi:hypothetical protein